MAGFTARMERGAGFFIDRAEIEQQKPTRITDLLQRIPNDAALPEEIGGIDVYTHVARIPVQFRDSNSMCGVVAIWSRRK